MTSSNELIRVFGSAGAARSSGIITRDGDGMVILWNFSFCKKGFEKSVSHRRRQTVRAQFSKDDVENSDSFYWIIDDDVGGDVGVEVELAAK
jgi:hypothetical protein